MKDFELARAIALKFHGGQMYGREPYITHLDTVAEKASHERDDRLPVVAMLHDILEDTTATYQMLVELFGDDIANAVKSVSKNVVPHETHEEYIARVRANPLGRKTKMYDSVSNLEESLKRGDMKRVIKYSKQLQALAE